MMGAYRGACSVVAVLAGLGGAWAADVPLRPNEAPAAESVGAENPEWMRRIGVVTTLDVVVTRDAAGAVELRAGLGDLLQRPEGRGLERIRLVGRLEPINVGGRRAVAVRWHTVALEDQAGVVASAPLAEAGPAGLAPEIEKKAALGSPLESAFLPRGERVARGVRVTAQGDVPAMVEAARSLLETEKGEDLAGRAGAAGEDGRAGAARGNGGAGDVAGSGLRTAAAGSGAGSGDAGSGLDSGGVGVGSGTDGAGSGSIGGGAGSGGVGSGPTAGTPGTVGTPDGADGDEEGTPGSGDELEPVDQAPGEPGGSGPDEPGYPEIAVISTEDGCSPRDSRGEGVVIIQERTITYTDGEVTAETACEDTLQRYQVARSYGGCGYEVDRTGGVAVAKARRYWSRQVGIPIFLGDCEAVAEDRAQLIATAEGCEPVYDPVTDTVQGYERLVYTDREGRKIEVEACRKNPDMTQPVQWTAAGCGPRHDMTAGMSYEQQRAVVPQGVGLVEVAMCQDKGRSWRHEVTADGCTGLVDQDKSLLLVRERTIVRTGEGVQTIAECAVSSEGKDLAWTAETCGAVYTHNIAAGVSYPHGRLYYGLGPDRVYVTGCEPATDRPVNHQSEIFDWVHDDQAKTSRVRLRTFIQDPSGVVVEVAAPAFSSASPAVGYAVVKEYHQDLPNETRYSECAAVTPRRVMKQYQRADGSVVELEIRREDGPVRNACVGEPYFETAFWQRTTEQPNNMYSRKHYCRYQLRVHWDREDGQRIATSWKYGAGSSQVYNLFGELVMRPGVYLAWKHSSSRGTENEVTKTVYAPIVGDPDSGRHPDAEPNSLNCMRVLTHVEARTFALGVGLL